MPELPEVETTKNDLTPYVVGRRITDVTLLYEGIVKEPSAAEFRRRIIGQTVTGISRRAKYLLFQLSNGETLIIHLRMSGSLLVARPTDHLQKYARAIIHLDDDKVYFRDPRKFGVMKLVKDPETVIGKLGPEPLEAAFTPKVLGELMATRKAPIKAVLCDQEVIAGIGNMYADEALFLAKIGPLRSASSLKPAEIKRLHKAIQEVLWLGIGNKGASEVTFYRPGGEAGKAFEAFKVAHRRGENCPVCATPLVRIAVRGRGTYYCPKCQKS